VERGVSPRGVPPETCPQRGIHKAGKAKVYAKGGFRGWSELVVNPRGITRGASYEGHQRTVASWMFPKWGSSKGSNARGGREGDHEVRGLPGVDTHRWTQGVVHEGGRQGDVTQRGHKGGSKRGSTKAGLQAVQKVVTQQG
jgi:hypothetical protein